MDDASSPRAKKINAMEARRNFGTNLEQVYYNGAQFIIERAGKPMAALVPVSLLEEWQKNSSQAKTGHDTIKARARRSPRGKS
jgi:prevent-host-death family protein